MHSALIQGGWLKRDKVFCPIKFSVQYSVQVLKFKSLKNFTAVFRAIKTDLVSVANRAMDLANYCN